MKIPQVLIVEVMRAPGHLANVLAQVGFAGLVVDNLEAISRTSSHTLWELTI